VCIRTQAKKQQKGPIPLDLFEPYEYGYEFKVIVTNKTARARRVAAFQEGRASQGGVLPELKSHCHVDWVPLSQEDRRRFVSLRDRRGVVRWSAQKDWTSVQHGGLQCRGRSAAAPEAANPDEGRQRSAPCMVAVLATVSFHWNGASDRIRSRSSHGPGCGR
jgi:hypothetical protein